MAFRRVIFSGDEVEDVKKDIERTFNILKAKMDASGLKRTIKNGAKPNTLLVDLNGEGADSISKKLKEIGNKFKVTTKIRTELKLAPVKESKTIKKSELQQIIKEEILKISK
jgi:hypothetical protein